MKTQVRSVITKSMSKKDTHSLLAYISHGFVEGLQIPIRHYIVIKKTSL
jgi:hypothetical protein